MFNLLHSSALFDKLLCNESNHYEKYGQFQGSHTTKSTLFTICKDEWDTKEDAGKSMKNVQYCTVVGQKAPLRLKQHQTVKNQAHSLSHCWVMLVWRHQSVRQIISQYRKFLKFHSNLFESALSLLESLFGLIFTYVLYCYIGKLRLVFWWVYFVGCPCTFVIPTMKHYIGSWYVPYLCTSCHSKI